MEQSEFIKWYNNSGCGWSFTTEQLKTNEAKMRVGFAAALEAVRHRVMHRGTRESLILWLDDQIQKTKNLATEGTEDTEKNGNNSQ